MGGCLRSLCSNPFALGSAELRRSFDGKEQSLIRTCRRGDTPNLASFVQGTIAATVSWTLHVADSVRRGVNLLNSWSVELQRRRDWYRGFVACGSLRQAATTALHGSSKHHRFVS